MESTTQQLSAANREIRHLQEMVVALRTELDVLRLEKDRDVQQTVTDAHIENQQLKSTVNALREELEKLRFDAREQVQRVRNEAQNEINQLKATLTALRNELEDLHHRRSQPDAASTGLRATKEPHHAG